MQKNNFERFLSEEDRTQRAIIDYIQLKYGRYRKFLAHPANEGKRSAFEQFKIKYLGLSAGLPDLMMFLPMGNYNGLAIEVKARGKKPTVEQLLWLDNLENHCGWMARWVDDLQTAIDLINLYFSEKPYRFIPTKETNASSYEGKSNNVKIDEVGLLPIEQTKKSESPESQPQ